WRSIPDPCLSKSEIRLLFGNVISSRRLHTMIEYYKFYIVEETDEMDDEVPRPLQHLCRVAVRSALSGGGNASNLLNGIKKYVSKKCPP
ncbi:hypothetical protein AVEN_8509-1, partial [Araneus ventricosus]